MLRLKHQFGPRLVDATRLHRLRSVLWSERPYRQKLAIAAWFSLMPISLLASVFAFVDSKQMVVGRVRQESLWDAAEIRESLTTWEQTHLAYLGVLSDTAQMRSMQPDRAAPLLQRAQQWFPKFSFSLIDPNGVQLVTAGQGFRFSASNGNALQPAGQPALWAAVRSEIPATLMLRPPQVPKPCLASTVPVRFPGAGSGQDPIGYLASCLPIQDLGTVAAASMMLESATDGTYALPLLDLDEGKRTGWAALLVVEPGTFVELDPNEDVDDQESHLDPNLVRRSAWNPIVRLALDSKAHGSSFHELTVDGTDYFVAINRVRAGRPVVVMVDQGTIFAPMRRFFLLAVSGHLLAIAIGTAWLLRICGQLSRPIDKAGERLLEISRGEFGPPLPESNNDIGKLYGYVNQASGQLQRYLHEELQHAALSSQLVEARRIQADFLIKNLPQSDAFELAALFQPAYQIGADWYDAFVVNGLTFLVVADVCDKGIPSALYMSVFRSLLRHSLQQECLNNSLDPQTALIHALTMVNTYMASNHGDTGMFATVFVAAYDASASCMDYIVAGHELPLLLTGQSLHKLELGGPAVGIFETAVFRAFHVPFSRDSILLAFTDGLPDARSPENVSFGSERILRILLEHLSSEWTAASLIQRLHDAATIYMDGSDQFDDLTLLALKALPPPRTPN